jgi:hypothetical protein
MNLNSNTYSLSESKDDDDEHLRYFFISEGKESIIKIIDYQYIQEYENHRIYNKEYKFYGGYRDEFQNSYLEDYI